jgi:hypothetical protein
MIIRLNLTQKLFSLIFVALHTNAAFYEPHMDDDMVSHLELINDYLFV